MTTRTSVPVLNAIFRVSGGTSLVRFGAVFAFLCYGVLQASVLFFGAWHDGTLVLPGTGKGLLNHYGVWAIVATDPLIVISVGIAHALFRRAIVAIRFQDPARRKEFMRVYIKGHLDFLYLKTGSVWVYTFLVSIGGIAIANNIYQTMSPTYFYGNDVFDDVVYRFGFIANKINLFISWVIIYPSAGFLLVTMCIQTRLLVEQAKKLDGLKGDLFHPDQCFGFARLAWLNVGLLAPYILVFIVMFSLSLTHIKMYQSLVFPFFVVTFLFIFASYWIIGPVSDEARRCYDSAYNSVLGLMSRPGWSWEKINYNLSLTRLCLSTTSPSPYAPVTSKIMILIRLAPATLAIFRLILPTSV